MKVIITESKKEKMSEYAEQMLKYGGKLMQCIDSLDEGGYGNRDDDDDDFDDDEGFGMRGEYPGGRAGYGMRGGGSYGMRDGGSYGMRDGMMGERRGVRGTGPYSRYRR